MQQNSLFVRDQLAHQFWLLHPLWYRIFKHIEKRTNRGILQWTYPHLFELLVRHHWISDRNSTVTFPPMVSLQTLLSQDMPNLLSLKIELDKIAPEINGNGSISLPPWQTLFRYVCNQSNSATKRAIVISQGFCWNGVVLEHEFFELHEVKHTFLRRAIVSSSTTLVSILGLCLRLLMAIF